MKTKTFQPPRWAERLIERIAASHLKEEILGDLFEVFQKRNRRFGLFAAQLFYMLDIILLIHPRLWRRAPEKERPSLYPADSSTPNPIAMLSNHIKVAFRKLNRHKSYTIINTVSLTMGIACAVLIFSLVKYHLSFEDFHTGKDRIFRIYSELHGKKIAYNTGVPNPMGQAFRSEYAVAETVGRIAYLPKRVVSLPSSNRFEQDIAFADPEFFAIFNFPLIEGSASHALQGQNAALITEQLARKYFGDSDAMGQTIRIDDSLRVQVTGVLADLPDNTDFRSQIFVPFGNLQRHSPWMVEKDWWMSVNKEMQCFVRLKPGISAASVNTTVLPAISNTHYDKEASKYFRFKLQPLADVHFNRELRGKTDKKNLYTFAWIGFFLVLTACVNFVNLATAQAVSRSREIGVRKALGSQRGALFWQFMTETALIATGALVAGVGLAYLSVPVVNQLFEINLYINPFKDIYLLAFLGTVLVVVVFCSGAYPGLILARFQPVAALKGKLTQSSPHGFSLRKGLVVGQFAISQLLIIGTLVMTNQLRYSQQANIGFEKDAVVIVPVPDNQKSKITSLKSELNRLSGIEKATFFDTPPASDAIGSSNIQFDTRPENEQFMISIKAADDQYVPMFKIPLLAGRNLSPSDTIREYLLNETAVNALGLKTMDDAIGKTATINGRQGTVVGVVKDFHFRSLRTAIEPLCMTTRGEAYGSCGLKINLSGMPSTIARLETQWAKIYPSSIFTYRFLDEDIERLYKLDNVLLRLIQAFAAVAISVGCLGLYGLVSFMATQKTKEIGVRKVLGAKTPDVLWLFGKEFLQLLLIAFLLSAPLGYWLTNNWLRDFAYHIEPGPGIFVLAIIITLLVAFFTVGFRSIKASLANPIKTLRSE